MKTAIISTKEIRQDLEGFLRRLRDGQVIQVMYRSRPIVTVTGVEQESELLAKDAGTPAAAKRSVEFLRSLPKRPTRLDPNKNFKELYKETRTLPDDYSAM